MKQAFSPRSWEWIDQSQFVCRERSLATDDRRLISREVVVHAERGVIVDQFYAERLYTRDEIRQLLSDAGFEQVREHEVLEAESDRNQDLGMMAQRPANKLCNASLSRICFRSQYFFKGRR